MKLSVVSAKTEFKFVDEGENTGTFEGYGAVFGNVDSHGDAIVPGAFKASLEERAESGRGLPPMYKMHGFMSSEGFDPVGKWTQMYEDDKGLYVKGIITGAQNTEKGRYIYEQVKNGSLGGLSIGFITKEHESGSGKSGEPRRYLKRVDLREVSLVDEPSNERAIVQEMRSRFADCNRESFVSIRECERFLREVGGLSHTEARSLAEKGFYHAFPREEDGANELESVRKGISEGISGLLQTLKS